ncbi:clathrin-like protein, putative [Bodo saltans]|uniref:Clathrin-like protein, putative n=1 Tax=Bodo saltans TaxID=75058 RepID=A0A0S4J1Z6_BODSA|nr:clathrin-like protein, putative [Bodo saltans]|eukprot:CUG62747.1 clathrin-like protein, putative [Bodo saltans]
METLVSSSACAIESGLRGVVVGVSTSRTSVALGLSDGRIFYCALGSGDLTILHDFDACPEKTGVPLLALRYVAALDCLLALSADGVLWMHLRDERSDMFFPGNCVADGVDCLDVFQLDDDALIAVHCSTLKLIQVIRVTRIQFDVVSEFPCPSLSALDVGVSSSGTIRLVWVAPTIICVISGTEFAQFVGLDGLIVPPSIERRGSRVLAVTPLAHKFSWDDKSSTAAALEQFAVTFEAPSSLNEYFIFKTNIYHVNNGEIRVLRSFDLLSIFEPRFVACFGPWLAFGSVHGLDFYDPDTGSFVQSTMEDVDLRLCDLQWEVSRAVNPSRDWFTERRIVVCINSADQMTLLTLRSFPDVIGGLMQNAAFQMNWIESLMQFGHSVGANVLMPPGVTANVSSKSALFTAYGKLISRCAVHQDDDDDLTSSGGSDVSPHRSLNDKNSKEVCPVCWKKISFIGSHRCNACGLKVCGTCNRRINIAEYGLQQLARRSGNIGNVCVKCDGAADGNFYRLLVARRYHHVIRYLATYPERCSQFSLEEVIQCCTEQCFHEKKYQWTAKLVCSYIQAEDAWQTWILSFSVEGRLGLLVDVLPDSAAAAAGTTILLQLIRRDTARLFRILRRWKITIYDSNIVCEGIITRLRGLQRDALRECERFQRFSSSAVAAAVDRDNKTTVDDVIGQRDNNLPLAYGWYFDSETEHLLQSLLRVVELQSTIESAQPDREGSSPYRMCLLYLEHYLSWAPATEFFSATRRRSESVFGDFTFRAGSTRRLFEVFDFWEVFSSFRLLPRFVAANPIVRDDQPLLVSVLQHFCGEFCRHLFTYEGNQFQDLVYRIFSNLKKFPTVKLRFLHEMTVFSPKSTSDFHQDMADLYLELAPGSLLGFVRNRQVDSLDWLKLGSLVEQRRMFPELVYIIGRTGNDAEAIRVALRCLGNVAIAIEYVVDSGDSALWELTIEHVVQSPQLIGQFLDVVGDRYDPAKFLARLPTPNRFSIPNVCSKLARLCVDRVCSGNIAEAQVSVLADESFGRLRTLNKQSKRGVKIMPYMESCILCKKPTFMENTMVAGSRGVMHQSCFQSTFRQFQSQEHVTKDLLWDLARYRTKKSVAVRDPIELLPNRVIITIMSFLDSKVRARCEAVSTKWRRTFVGHRRSVWSTGGNLHSVYRQKVQARMTSTSKNYSAVNRTVSTTALAKCGLYYIKDEETNKAE